MPSMFTKRHYEAVAAVLSESRASSVNEREDGGLRFAWLEIRDRLADLFEADNPEDGKGRGFKRDKWEEACER